MIKFIFRLESNLIDLEARNSPKLHRLLCRALEVYDRLDREVDSFELSEFVNPFAILINQHISHQQHQKLQERVDELDRHTRGSAIIGKEE